MSDRNSGFRPRNHVEALTDSIERFAREGRIALWAVVDLFPALKPHHWAAYARDAGIPMPDQATINAAVSLYQQRVGYRGASGTPVHSATADTLPGLNPITKIAR